MAFGFAFRGFLLIGLFSIYALFILLFLEIVILYSGLIQLTGEREHQRMMSLGDENTIKIALHNASNLKLKLELFDEVPFQFQWRDFKMNHALAPEAKETLCYSLRPVTRGEYAFGNLNAFVSIWLGLCSRRYVLSKPTTLPVMPSVIQMKKYELLAFSKISTMDGIKKLRRIGHSYEFEQIRPYADGDDLRSVNWKATGRRNQIMVNQYQEERSQNVYLILDKSRTMHMPFNGLSLLDYSINSSLVLGNIALKKYDRVGLISYSHRIGSTLPAERNEIQLKKLMNALYHERPQEFEADFDLLYRSVKNIIKNRSLIILYTNFESIYAMERALPVLQKVNQQHLLVVIIFENSELTSYQSTKAEFVSDIYSQTITAKLMSDKRQMVNRLKKCGIQTILSKPEDLSINTVNKYLELKAKGLI